MDLYDYNTIKRILTRHGFTFSKALGQNFLIDPSVCPRMAAALEADDRTGVLEIGPGIGVLTKELSAVCGRVAAVELDRRLPDVLAETLADCPNVQVVPGDVLQMDLQALFADQFAGCDRMQVCANLPYYITTPVPAQGSPDRWQNSDSLLPSGTRRAPAPDSLRPAGSS